jgi:hypothetical protein
VPNIPTSQNNVFWKGLRKERRDTSLCRQASDQNGSHRPSHANNLEYWIENRLEACVKSGEAIDDPSFAMIGIMFQVIYEAAMEYDATKNDIDHQLTLYGRVYL